MKRYSPLLMLLVLLGALAVTQVAAASSPSRPASTFAQPTLRDVAEPEEEFETEETEIEFEECEATAEEFAEDEDEDEEFEEEECGKGTEASKTAKGGAFAPFVTAPPACQVRQAESKITTLPGSDQVRLDVHYRTYGPTQVTVGLKLKDHKGSVAIEHATEHFGAKGVLHITTKIGTALMERAAAASEFDIALRAPGTPGYCADALEQRLQSGKHTAARAPRVFSN